MATKNTTKKNTTSKNTTKNAKAEVKKTENLAVELMKASELPLKSELDQYEVREIETPKGSAKFCVVRKDGLYDTRNTDPMGRGLAVCEAIMGWAAVLEHIGSEAAPLLFVKPVSRVGKYGTMALEQAKVDAHLDEIEQQMHDELRTIAIDNSFKKSWRATAVQLKMIERSTKTRKGGSAKSPETTPEEVAAATAILNKLKK